MVTIVALVPAAAIGGAGGVDFGARPRAADEPDNVAASIQRLQADVGFVAATSPRVALQRTVGFWRQQIPS